MRLPFLQLAQEEMARARTLAGYLGVPWPHAVGMVMTIKAAVLEVSEDASGLVPDERADEWLAVQAGWPVADAARLGDALRRCTFVVAGPQPGHFVAGMEPYQTALRTSSLRSEAGRRGADARKLSGGYGRAMAGLQPTHGQGVARDAKTQTQTHREDLFSAVASAPAAPAKKAKEAKKGSAQSADPRHAPLRMALEAIGFPFRDGRDAKAVAALLALGDRLVGRERSAAEVERRGKVGWAWTGHDSKLARSMTDLVTNWGHYSGPPATSSALPRADDPDWVTV